MADLTMIVVKLQGEYSQREIDLILDGVNNIKAVIDFDHDDRNIDIGFGDLRGLLNEEENRKKRINDIGKQKRLYSS